jgi:hypothetical protein
MMQGSHFETWLRAKDSVGADVGLDLTGCVFRSQMRAETGGALLLEFDVDHSRLAEGYVGLTATAAQTAMVTRPGVYDVEYSDPDGRTWKLLRGNISLTKEVTE